MNAILIQEINKNDLEAIELGRLLFMNYFTDLYKDILPATLQIGGSTESYLNTIFERTKSAIENDPSLQACLAYLDNKAVGFTTFGPLEDPNIILIRTLPINIAYKEHELIIRNSFITHVKQRHSNAQKIIIMVRKANIVHQNLCLMSGFQQNDEIFISSDYVKKTYDYQSYNAYCKLTL